ncbi:MAG: N-acetylmuramoyl-L-alanine amidase family protein [Lachnospiraceae bacterium]|jgi:glucan-binding YG repeat protein|nr:N-acetylmuramoyl-L-alanine amidase family protein [Lachnospiraceae bacterium]
MKRKLLSMFICCMLCFSILYTNTGGVQAATGALSKIEAEYIGDDLTYGEEIVKDDIRVKAYYSGSSKGYRLDSSEFEIDPEEITEEKGNQRVTVSYTNDGVTKTDKIRINIRAPYVESIDAEYLGDGTIVGGSILKEDVEVIAHYEDGSEEEVTDFYFNDYKIKKGNNKITVYYEENGKRQKDYIEVEGFDGKLLGISAKYYGGTLKAGSQVDLSKITVTGNFDINSRYRTVESEVTGWTLSDYRLVPGNNELIINYQDKTNTYTTKVVVRAEGTTSQWINQNNKWYYLQNDGTYKTRSWLQDKGKWYYFLNDGSMATGWIMVDGKWYFMNADGEMLTGWVSINGKWYYMNRDGQMMTGWIMVDGKYYFMNHQDGVMITNSWVGNYYVDPNGVWTKTR